jgi:hypothetical protein
MMKEHNLGSSRRCKRVANAPKRWILATTGLVSVLGIASTASASASALTIKLEFSGGATTLVTSPTTGLTVDLFAVLTNEFSGQNNITASVSLDSALTPTLCSESAGPQSVGGASWSPFSTNCGSGFPGDGGIGGSHPPGIVAHIEQDADFDAGTSGTLHLGTITFDALTPGSHTITPFFDSGIDGWLDATFGPHVTGTFEGATVNVVPEPGTGVLLGFGISSFAMTRRRGACSGRRCLDRQLRPDSASSRELARNAVSRQ